VLVPQTAEEGHEILLLRYPRMELLDEVEVLHGVLQREAPRAERLSFTLDRIPAA
jgi:hypothetical protein